MSRGGGGGGGGTNWADLELDERRRQDAEAERQRQEQAAAQRRADYQALLGRTRQGFGQTAQRVLTERGLNPGEFLPVLTQEFERVAGTTPEGDMTIGQRFGDDFIADALARTRDNRRQRYTTEARNAFAPNSEASIFDYSMDDPIVAGILGTQREDAQAMLTRAQARGNLDDNGFSRGLQRIGELETAGRSEADRIANAVVDNARTRLRGVGDRALADAGAYDLGTNFDLGTYRNEWDTTANTLRSNFEGDVRSALEGQQFFDLGDLITRAGIAQGAQNPSSTQADAIAQRLQVRNAQRGVDNNTGGTF